MSVTIEEIATYVVQTFPDVYEDRNWGERALFYNPRRQLPKGVYFLTFKEKDGANDRASKIGQGEYRLNVGISRRAFVASFGNVPARPPAGGVVAGDHDFSRLDVVTPHPVYGGMCWIAVKSPSAATFEALKPALAEAYEIAKKKFEMRLGTRRTGPT